ncbi:EamA family transporter [Lactobacillus sp. DCY120]|uniref:EamA family transporter n=1 Tax=Bombilactobacillus apium TaxID=2675299 RepID=A0A850RBP6_9LACO|nr:DMT family transporter [Bombilactobacillus apium]NVY96736.1 EamA family transporter [Bombilactobacillus apium]
MHPKLRGLCFVITGGIFWGASGTVAQYLFSRYHLAPLWLVEIRLLCAGLLLLLTASCTNPRQLFTIWRQATHRRQLLYFSFCGMLTSQATYFLAINYGNAPTATVLQFLGPLFIIAWVTWSQHLLPRRIDLWCVALALIGTFLLVTSGNLKQLSLTPAALFWGLVAGIGQACYTLLPRQLLKEFPASIVVGWAMLLGSLPFSYLLFTQPLPAPKLPLWGGIGFIIVFGTMFSYWLYLKSLQDLSPETTGMLSSFEPLTATILAIFCLQTPFSGIQLLGGGLILSTTFLQALPAKKAST